MERPSVTFQQALHNYDTIYSVHFS